MAQSSGKAIACSTSENSGDTTHNYMILRPTFRTLKSMFSYLIYTYFSEG
jgi:hypothetical protein